MSRKLLLIMNRMRESFFVHLLQERLVVFLALEEKR
jgi:hypothetical protein